jgi:hypothetical protein
MIVTRFGAEFDRQVCELAERQGLTKSELVREAVYAYLARATEEGAVAS